MRGGAGTSHHWKALKIAALDNIDEVIKIIRGAKDTPAADAALRKRFGLSEKQSEAILNMRLARLTALEIDKLEAELKEVQALIKSSSGSSDRRKSAWASSRTSSPRSPTSTATSGAPRSRTRVGAFNVEDLIVEEDMVVTVSHPGLREAPPPSIRTGRSGAAGAACAAWTRRKRTGVEHLFVASTHDYLMIFTRRGQCYWKKVWEIPVGSRTSRGKPIINLLNLGPDEKIAAVVPVREFSPDRNLIFGTRRGIVKKTALSAYGNVRTVGLNAMNIQEATNSSRSGSPPETTRS